jgi:hypothetical protein
MEDALIEQLEAEQRPLGFDTLHLLRSLTDERVGDSPNES